jgi:hypothetical protein
MVLHAITSEPAGPEYVPVWQAIAATQLPRRDVYWLIPQPDHAALSGALAGRFASAEFPQLEPEVVQAIGLHDAGWAMFESEAAPDATPPLNGEGKPLSFFEIAPPEFLRAWSASIARAEEVAPVGGIMVSRHFCWLGQYRLGLRTDTPEIAAMLRQFLKGEAARQQRLSTRAGRAETELQRLTATLQFCDLLSLYLCCGTHDSVEFPQPLASRPIRLAWRDGGCRLDPSPFPEGVSMGVVARRYPPDPSAPTTTSLGFLLW